jgi:hypothetical protein
MNQVFSNLAIFVAALYPAFMVSFLVIASIFNLKLNGLVYLGGIVATFVICLLIGSVLGSNERKAGHSMKTQHLDSGNYTCDFFSFAYPYTSPSYNVAITWFTFIYLLIPMVHNIYLLNPIVIALTAIFALINMVYLVRRECTTLFGSLLGTVIGLGMGAIWYAIWQHNKSLLFYNELVSNNVLCERRAKQTFKCHVYKHGELISSSIV